MELLIPLPANGLPLFRQIYLGLRKAIDSGRLRPGKRLPSTRDLAEQLGVSRTVVLLAYEQLLAEGLTASRHGSGTYVVEALHLITRKEKALSIQAPLSRFGKYAAGEAPNVHFPEVRSPVLRYDFAYGGSNIQLFPFEAWRRALLRNARKISIRDIDYGSSSGAGALRESICAYLQRARAVICDPSQVIIVNGSQQALDLVARVLLEPGQRVVIEEPQYQGTRQILRAAGARLIPIAVDHEGLITSKLPDDARLAFVTPSHQFPTGVILTLERRLKLLAWAKRRNAIVIEDDYDGEFRYKKQPMESLHGLDPDGRVIYIGTFSRTIFPALRIGYMIVPKSLISVFRTAKWLCDRHTATLEQQTLADFLSNGHYERCLHRIRRRNAFVRAALLDAIHRYLGDRVEVSGDGAGVHLVLWPTERLSEETIIERAASRGVGVYGIAPYFLKQPSRAGLMIGYSRMKDAAIREGIRRLSEVL
jgi:GntR family transcriptional regulator / MocR family aminotransferase